MFRYVKVVLGNTPTIQPTIRDSYMKPLDTDMILKNSESHELNLLEDVESLFCWVFFFKFLMMFYNFFNAPRCKFYNK